MKGPTIKSVRQVIDCAANDPPRPILTYCHACKDLFDGAGRHGERCPKCGGTKTTVP